MHYLNKDSSEAARGQPNPHELLLLSKKNELHIFEKTGRLFKRMKMEIGKKRQYFRTGITGFMLRRTSRFLREGRFLSRE